MLDKNYWLSGTERRGAGATLEHDEPASSPGEDPACCTQPMKPHLAHTQDHMGKTVFVAVWRCQVCGRVALGGS